MAQVFSTETLTITPYVRQYFEKMLVPLKGDMKGYKFSISGPISAGKSTLLQILYNLFIEFGFEVGILQEYINSDPTIGSELLGRFINGDTTNTTFQNYILDTYRKSYSKINKDANIIMMERVPDDSILIFANITNRNKPEDMNELSLYALYNKMLQYNKECDFPSYLDDNTHIESFIGNIDDVLLSIIDIIVNDIKMGIKKRIIGLKVDVNTCIQRIKRRGRKEESNYDPNYLKQIIHAYDEIFRIKNLNLLMKSQLDLNDAKYDEKLADVNKRFSIRFTNIGRLIDAF